MAIIFANTVSGPQRFASKFKEINSFLRKKLHRVGGE